MIEPNALQIKGFKKQIYWQFIEKEIFNHAHSVHCITKQESQYSKQLAQTNTFIVPNGVSAKALTNKNNINNVFCFIGRIHEIKGLDLLLRAIADIKNIKLIIAGSGIKQYEDYILNLIKTLKIENRIEWLGFANENIKYKIFLSSCCTIVPSHSEVLSIVGIESIANSTPVLITRQCNFNEIEEFNAGMIMPDNNPDTIKKYLLKMLDSDIDVMSKNAYNLAMEKYDIDIVSKKILDKFKQIITLKKR
ncbi:Glycosyltransferase [uncultured Candidatus Thioglobus sp.]|nr:Glycosyltransferase [uncultured Candidatus Thioglobus sp.]